MIRTDGNSWPPSHWTKKWFRFWDRFRHTLVRDVEVIDDDNRYRFRCENLWELTRSMSLFTKEPGTCEWIKSELAPGEVFYDIGANIGIYSILAAYRVGKGGKVYAFEPHSVNFSRLATNIVANNLQQIIVPCNFALNDEDGYFPFNYSSLVAASADSQLRTLQDAHEKEYRPELSELKSAATVDSLIEAGIVLPPHHAKVDVDGNELLILRGMHKLLEGNARPKSIQIEINKRDKERIVPFMEEYGYELAHKHYTASGLKLIRKGGDPEAYTYNAVFRPGS